MRCDPPDAPLPAFSPPSASLPWRDLAHRVLQVRAAVLEVTPRHALIRSLAARCETGGDVAEAAQMLLDLARVQDGDAPRDPATFARRVAEALAAAAVLA